MKNYGRETTIEVGGVTYKAAKLSLDVLQQFAAWAKDKLPDPFTNFAERVRGLAPEIQQHAWDKACEEARVRGTYRDPALQDLMGTIDGIRHLVYLLLKKYQPHLTRDEADRVVDQGIEEHGEDFFTKLVNEAAGENPASETDVTEDYLREQGKWPHAKKK